MSAPTMEQQRDACANDLTEALKLRDRLRKHIDDMRTALVEAREALNCWARHDYGCPGRNEGDEYCTCGLWQSRDVVERAIRATDANAETRPPAIAAAQGGAR